MEENKFAQSIEEGMRARDHSLRKCPRLFNCYDMSCLRTHPDQVKIYQQ